MDRISNVIHMDRPEAMPPALFVEEAIIGCFWLLRIDSKVSSLSGCKLLIGEVFINPLVDSSLSEIEILSNNWSSSSVTNSLSEIERRWSSFQ